ncbi:hypothetical protein [Streptomyces sp. NPDC097619]|uniref:hypothetical protein n=1 Tax=Streptomyces sp. NPDC097619 TaxID=3157228 RepID=UPI003320FF80
MGGARRGAWLRFTSPTAPPPDSWQGELAREHGLRPSGPRLAEVAERYDAVQRAVEHAALDKVPVEDLLAALLVIRKLREKLVEDEARFIAAARHRGVTWQRLAGALELGSRQAAERRYLQLTGGSPAAAHAGGTQAERVTRARRLRGRRAADAPAPERAERAVDLATRLAAVPDLQELADRSPYARLADARARVDEERLGLRPGAPVSMAWPRALRHALAGLRGLTPGTARHAEAVGDLLKPLREAADPERADASGHPELFARIRELVAEAADGPG